MASYGKVIKPSGRPPESDDFINWERDRIISIFGGVDDVAKMRLNLPMIFLSASMDIQAGR
jgi:hypothetical protein